MVIKDSALEKVRTMVKGEFAQHLQALESSDEYRKLATIINSSSQSNTYGWLGKFPQIREWIGERTLKSITESSYVLENRKYESTLSVERTDIEDDNIGMYPALVRSMAEEVTAFFNRNIVSLLARGHENICYDGQRFFDTEHPVYPETDGNGEPVLVSNIHGDAAKSGTPWFLLSLSGTLKPFILQQRISPVMEEITTSNNDTVFLKDVFMYGVRWRGNFGYGLWQQAILSKEPLTPASYQAARLQMQRFTRDGGDPLGLVPTHLVVSIQNEYAAREIVEAQIIGNNSNINYKTAQLIVSPWLHTTE